jgi:hypothetical protein
MRQMWTGFSWLRIQSSGHGYETSGSTTCGELLRAVCTHCWRQHTAHSEGSQPVCRGTSAAPKFRNRFVLLIAKPNIHRKKRMLSVVRKYKHVWCSALECYLHPCIIVDIFSLIYILWQ